MEVIADPMIVLNAFQQALNDGAEVNPADLDENHYLYICDEQPSGIRHSYVKVINGVAQALSIFGTEPAVTGFPCFSVGCAVMENLRGKGLAIEAINKGIRDLKIRFKGKTDKFYIEGVIAKTNTSSLKAAAKLLPGTAEPTIDSFSGTPSYFFKKLISMD